MRCRFFSTVRGFLDVAARFLAEYEAENTVLVGRALRCVRRPRSNVVMAVVQDDDAVRLAALMTPPHALVLSTGHADAIPCLVEGFRAAAIRPPGVSGVEAIAERFAAAWTSREHAVARPESRMNLYRATSIRAPADVPGELRTASDDDLERLAAWQFRFAEQAGLSAAERTADMRAVVAARLARGEMVVWAVHGRPVSNAAFVPTTPAGDAGRIIAVFTLEEEHGKGYASACVAALSRQLLERGWRYCLIFADRGNPITTRIYPRLGYRRIATFSQMAFDYGN
jgi:hypothetical protein